MGEIGGRGRVGDREGGGIWNGGQRQYIDTDGDKWQLLTTGTESI